MIYDSIDKNQKSIANGILQATSILAIGARIDTCPKLNIIIGIVNTKADSVRTKLSWIANFFGRKKNIFLKNHCV
jgi:hypothetical protein